MDEKKNEAQEYIEQTEKTLEKIRKMQEDIREKQEKLRIENEKYEQMSKERLADLLKFFRNQAS
jgi:uncharacterized protein YoxC